MKSVNLNDVVEKVEFFMDGWKLYYNKQTGRFVEIQEEYLKVAEKFYEEENGEYQDWEQDAIKEAIDLLENWDNYIELPDEYETNEYSIMEDFCYSISVQTVGYCQRNIQPGYGRDVLCRLD